MTIETSRSRSSGSNLLRWGLLPACLLLVGSGTASADPQPLVPVPPGDDKVVPLEAKQAAPFAGQLFDMATALRWANYLHQCKFRLDADVAYRQRLDEVDLTLLRRQLDLAGERYDRTVKEFDERFAAQQRQIVELSSPPFYRTVWFGVVTGVVGTVAVAVGSVALVHAAESK